MLPRPFTRVAVRFGDPIEIPEDLTSEEIGAWSDRVRDALVAVTAEAAEAVGVAAEVPDVDPLSSRA